MYIINKDERWLPGYKNIYFCNTQGKIYRVYKNTLRLVKGYFNKRDRSYEIKLTVKNISKTYSYARLIYSSFYGNIPKGCVVSRKTKCFSDNQLNNLECITLKQLGKKTGGSSRSKEVVLINQFGEVINYWKNTERAAKALFCCSQTIKNICNGKTKNPCVNVKWS